MPSITPSEARVWISARSLDYDKARQYYGEVVELAEDLATRAGITFKPQFISESRGYLPNDMLGQLLYNAMMHVGPPNWSEADLSFMAELCRSCSGETGMQLDRGVHFFDSGEDYYGQDDGEVSWRIPLGRVNWAYPKQVSIHHWSWTSLSGHSASHAGPLAASHALAIAAVTLLASPHIIEAAKKELNSRVQGFNLTEPRLGAIETLTRNPEAFWTASWLE
jgi:aminobenzoyl-glutamate utilization protein B